MSDRMLMLSLLQQIEAVMRTHGLWETASPPPAAFESDLPFCVDTLQFSQWLQWVFIVRFQALLDGNLPLPSNCNIATITEEAFKGMDFDPAELVALMQQFDALFD